MKRYDIVFWNPGHMPQDREVFGCASFGMVCDGQWIAPEENVLVYWRSLRGEVFAGTYAQMIEDVQRTNVSPNAILTFFTHGEGNDAFVDSMQALYPGVPILGGTAARTAAQETGEVLPAAEDGTILLVCEEIEDTGCRTIHKNIVCTVSCHVKNGRDIEKLDGKPAAEVLASLRKQLGKPETDFESITLRETCGKNVHCYSCADGSLHTGANFTESSVTICEIPRQEAQDAIASYMHKENTLSIGCAGLKSLVTVPFTGAKNNVGVFLFGEVLPFADGQSRFANLMLGRITARM